MTNKTIQAALLAIALCNAVSIGISVSLLLPKEKTTVVEVVSPFEEGWKEGYCEGWKYVCGPGCNCPNPPNPPNPLAGRDTYKDGYNSGFNAGMKAAAR